MYAIIEQLYVFAPSQPSFPSVHQSHIDLGRCTSTVSELNIANRTLAIMDNLPFLRSLNNECIDLIAIDPPFAANETFTNQPKPPISQGGV